MVKETPLGSPNWFKNPETAEANIMGGVPLGRTPFLAREPTAIRASTATRVSTSMAPKETGSMCCSLLTCLEAAPAATME